MKKCLILLCSLLVSLAGAQSVHSLDSLIRQNPNKMMVHYFAGEGPFWEWDLPIDLVFYLYEDTEYPYFARIDSVHIISVDQRDEHLVSILATLNSDERLKVVHYFVNESLEYIEHISYTAALGKPIENHCEPDKPGCYCQQKSIGLIKNLCISATGMLTTR